MITHTHLVTGTLLIKALAPRQRATNTTIYSATLICIYTYIILCSNCCTIKIIILLCITYYYTENGYLLSPTKCKGRDASSKWDHSSSSSTPPTLLIMSRISPVLTCCSRHHLGPSSNCFNSCSVNCSEPMKSSEKRSLSQHSCREKERERKKTSRN